MVAIALDTEPLFETPSRACGQDRTCASRKSSLTNSASGANLRGAAYVGRVRLVTCSKDPVGHWGGSRCLYAYVSHRPLRRVDPSGLIPPDNIDPRRDPITCRFLPPNFDPDPKPPVVPPGPTRPVAPLPTPAPPTKGCHSYVLVGHAGNVRPSIGNYPLPDCYRVGGICCFMESTQGLFQQAYPHTFPDWPTGTGDGYIYDYQFPTIFRNRAGPRLQALNDACKDCGCTQSSITHLCDDDATQGIAKQVRAGKMPRNWCAFTMNKDCKTGQITFTPNGTRLPWQPGITRNWPPLPSNWPWRQSI
ncbi:hypothetical protein Q31a_13880 [Aureliella helgolandensis]|uniref:Uncharacterized protein n=1 Tax=Aureliella helgolandensis TaxID=2527968 RepID=A0A518G3B8_9BACT|nr:hypothetical protein Q31a_13880 [Aureliella helgolandensis]